MNGNGWILLKFSLKFVPRIRINNVPALVQIMAWRRADDKPLSESMKVSLLTHICTHGINYLMPQRYVIIVELMMTSSNGNIFRVTGPLCGEFNGHQWIPRTKASDAGLWCFFYLRLNKRLSKHSAHYDVTVMQKVLQLLYVYRKSYTEFHMKFLL